ncbi:uncharacterized protein LOC142895421 isoform X2 [Nelusetta ayraudi]|uniref:uncharacterized protein LOC142895421 isoform X2 n=1 Tax=Nelusetta ayraudi TaxID=303726 RepID=UPI003F72ED72
MGCCVLLTLGLVLAVAHCSEFPGVEFTQNVTAFLGEEVYLSCRYLGEESDLQGAEWKRQINSRGPFRRLAGFFNGRTFNRSGFSEPDSITNLTVVASMASLEMEGEYKCQFAREEDDYIYSVFVTIVARPEILIQLNTETLDGVHYQSVVCSAVAGRPQAQISWLVKGVPVSGDPFTVDVSDAQHSNGTSTVSSVLRFPTHLQGEDSVACSVQHPTFQEDKVTAVTVETYAKPNVTITVDMEELGGRDFWVVSCISSGGRPETYIHLEPATDEDVQIETGSDSYTQKHTVVLPAAEYQGQHVTCVFQHPIFSHTEQRVATLPSFYLSAVQLWSSDPGVSSDFQATDSWGMQEGHESDVVIGLQVVGNVPGYNVSCKRDGEPLPDGVEVTGSSLTVRAPVALRHGGQYECVASYHHIQAALKFNITVRPRVTLLVPPTIAVDLRTEDGRWLMECSAAGAVPAANVSWLLPEGVSAASWFNSTSRNGSHSVRGVLLLPACSPWELTALCVINHPAFQAPQNRSVMLPMCAPLSVTFHSVSRWGDDKEYTKADCSVESEAPAAAITWHVGKNDNNSSSSSSSLGSVSATEDLSDGRVLARSSVRLLSSLYSGQDLTCMVQHHSLRAPEKRTTRIPEQKACRLSVRGERERDSPLWLAVCECNAGTNLAWVLPDSARGQTSMQSEYKGHVLRARLTYSFSLALHEGQNLTCVHHYGRGTREERTVQIPRYYISAVRVVNYTTPLQSRHDRQLVDVRRLTLQENLRNQRVLLQVEGNVPECNLICRRSDGTAVPMEESAMVFEEKVREQDAGVYSCRASFYHHTATVSFLVEVMSDEKLFGLVTMVGISSGSAVLIVLLAVLWVCRKGSRRRQYKLHSDPGAGGFGSFDVSDAAARVP